MKIYAANLARLRRDTQAGTVADLSTAALQRYLASLRATTKPVSVHQHYRKLRTFLGWCIASGLLDENPLRGVTMRLPKTLRRVAEDDEVRRLRGAAVSRSKSDATRALVALLAFRTVH